MSTQRHALITGSSRGIGRGIALALAEEKVRIAVHYFQHEGAAKDTLAEIRQRGSDGFIVQADVTGMESIKGMFSKVKSEFGSLDIFRSQCPAGGAHLFLPTFGHYFGAMGHGS